MLLTLGASHSLTDNLHGNTALHWAIIAENSTAISTLVHHGASLDVPNIRDETPMTLLGRHIGAAWLGHKISQEIRERQGRTRTWCRDKVCVLNLFTCFKFFTILHISNSTFREYAGTVWSAHHL